MKILFILALLTLAATGAIARLDMTKTLFILALLALAVTGAIARLDMTTYSQGNYELQQWQEWQVQLNPCQEFLQQQCSPLTLPFLMSQAWQASICQTMRQQCCQQLAQISEQYRWQAISSMAHAIMQQQLQQQWQQGFYAPKQKAQPEVLRMMALPTLPAMCSVYVPAHCSTVATTPCSITAAVTCASGATDKLDRASFSV